MATIEQILKSLDRLPAIPVSVTQLISKLCAPEDEVGGDTTTDIVMRDSALTADVLRAANSAALAFTSRRPRLTKRFRGLVKTNCSKSP